MHASLYVLFVVGIIVALYYTGLRFRNVHIWLWSYLAARIKAIIARPPEKSKPTHIIFCFVDHYEPLVGKADFTTGLERVEKWIISYRQSATKYRDADGKHPQHSYFYPQEEYHQEYLNKIARLCCDGFGEVEIHIHHDNATETSFREVMQSFISILSEKHGLLAKVNGTPKFGFIHGNWALDNSRKDGRWCGLNNEISILRDLGCYADFTLPSAPSDTQTKTINSIYYAVDDPNKPKSHNTGHPVTIGGKERGDLLIVQGPLTLNWKSRALFVWPRIENADITESVVPIEERVDLWIKTAVHIPNKPEWVFIKVHTHGCAPENFDYLFNHDGFDNLYRYLTEKYNDGKDYSLHFATAREMYNIIKAAEAGNDGNPGDYRDFVLPSPFH